MHPTTDLSIRGRSFWPLSTGLAAAHVLSTLFVWRSNQSVWQAVEAFEKAGWLAIPAGPAAASLKTFGAAFWGGLFFTLSIGVGLCLATWALLYLWRQFLPGKKRMLWVLAIGWIGLAVAVNLRGWVLFPTLFVVLIPLATALAAIRPVPGQHESTAGRLWPIPLAVLVLLTALWATQFNARMFVAIRDHLLLSNPAGRAVNDFYYRYTLYAAQTFKSFNQKEARACRLQPGIDDADANHWTRLLARFDVLSIRDAQPADLILSLAGDRVTLASPQGDRLEIKAREFQADPAKWLRQFSQKSDRYAPLRRLTFVGLLVGFPILLYVLVDGAIGRVAGLFTSGSALVWTRASLCMAIGLLLLLPMWAARPVEIQKEQIGAALAADAWPRRVAALRLMEAQKMEIADYPQYRALFTSPWVVERYYAARVMAYSRSPETLDQLLAMIHDPHPNVVCQAYFALGERKNPRAVAAIHSQMIQSGHWYTQWYGYRAMKRLGWRQTR